MVISDSQKFIFLHNPKCAGTTVRKSLKPFDTRNDYYWLFDDLDSCKVDKAHMPMHVLKRYNYHDFCLLEEYFVFGFVRNPYERIISAFNEGNKELYKKFSSGVVNIKEYKVLLNDFCSTLTTDNLSGWNIKYRHAVRQSEIYYLGYKNYADLIFKVENMAECSKKMEALFPSLLLAVECWSSKKNAKPVKFLYDELLEKNSIDTIRREYEKDFLLFDYNM